MTQETLLQEKTMVQDSVVRDLTEGILVIGFDGTIIYANPVAFSILGIPSGKMTGRKFASVFLDDPDNDPFVQTVLDAVQDREKEHRSIVAYQVCGKKKYLRVTTSYFRDADRESAGITMVLDDLSELMELKDSVKAMKQIGELNRKLEARNQLLSKTFGMFLSDEIVKELLDKPGGLNLGGKKKSVTMMMSDIRGFTALSERMGAADLIDMLNHYLGVMTEVIQGRGGTIIEFIGDGILALFGAPVSTKTHAADAVAAALEMQAAMDEVNRWNAQREYPRLEMGIGLNTGEVIVGKIGSLRRMKYGVVGSHVNLCGRIESYTVGGQVLISPSVKQNAGTDLTIATEMTVFPKGVEGGIVLSHVTGIGEPYGVFITENKDIAEKLENPVPVVFYRIDGKHTGERSCYGGIVSVGHSSAVMETKEEMQLYENIQVRAGGNLLCKVVDKRDDGILLQYTSIPSGYEQWIREAGKTDS